MSLRSQGGIGQAPPRPNHAPQPSESGYSGISSYAKSNSTQSQQQQPEASSSQFQSTRQPPQPYLARGDSLNKTMSSSGSQQQLPSSTSSPQPSSSSNNYQKPSTSTSSTSTSAANQITPEQSRAIARTHFDALRSWLARENALGNASTPRNNARDKLTRLTRQQFQELSTDVYDELVRRMEEAAGRPGEQPFLSVRGEFHPKRNQARQKLATLPLGRFRDLASDVYFELERRYPEFGEEENPSTDQASPSRYSPPPPIPSTTSSRLANNNNNNNGNSNSPNLNQNGPSSTSKPTPINTASSRGINGGGRAPTTPTSTSNATTNDVVVPNKSTMIVEESSSSMDGSGGGYENGNGNGNGHGNGGGGGMRGLQNESPTKSSPRVGYNHQSQHSTSGSYGGQNNARPSSDDDREQLSYEMGGSPMQGGKGGQGMAGAASRASQTSSIGTRFIGNYAGSDNGGRRSWENEDLEKVKSDYEYKLTMLQSRMAEVQRENDDMRDTLKVSTPCSAHQDLTTDAQSRLFEQNRSNDASRMRDLENQTNAAQSTKRYEDQSSTLQNLRADFSNLQNSRSRGGASNADIERLTRERAEAEETANELRAEVGSLVDEIRSVNATYEELIEAREKDGKERDELEEEVRSWKRKFEQVKTELRNVKATSQLFVGNIKMDADHMPASADGLIADVNVSLFQTCIDELLQAARSKEPSSVLPAMRAVVGAVEKIDNDVQNIEPRRLQSLPMADQNRLQALKAKINATISNLLTASKNHATSFGVSPVSLVDAAASHLSSAVVDLVRLLKIRRTAGSSMPSSTYGARSLDGHNNPPTPPTKSYGGSISSLSEAPVRPSLSTRASETSSIRSPSIRSPTINDFNNPPPRNAFGISPTPEEQEEDRYHRAPSQASSYGGAGKGYSSQASPRVAQSGLNTTNSQERNEEYEEERPYSSPTQGQSGEDYRGSHLTYGSPNDQPEERQEEKWEQLKNYLENQTEAIVHSIQSLLTAIRSGAQGEQLNENLTQIITIVSSIVAISKDALPDASRSEGESILQDLTDNCDKLSGMSQNGSSAVFDKQTKQAMASASFGVAKSLKGDTILPALSRLATAVAERAQARVPSYGPPAFRLPSRVTVNEQKRETWFNDLANPAVPLSKLSRNIPHGYVGEKRLEMLFVRQVPLLRAVWYIRAIGAIEIQASRTRPGFSIAHYTREWSAVVHEFVRKQLAEIACPDRTSATAAASTEHRSSLSASLSSVAAGKVPMRRVLADHDLRQAWTSRFSYTLRILEALYEEHLIDRDSFLRFLVQQTEMSNIGQLPFVLFLAEEYTAEFLLSEPLSARLVSACLGRLQDIPANSTSAALDETLHSLTSLIRSFFISLPDAFVASPLWTSHSKKLEAILLTPDLEPTLAETIKTDLADLSARAEASSEGTYDADSIEPDELETIQILDDIAFPADLTNVHKSLFHKSRRKLPIALELGILFTWATCSDRTGSHRAYAVAALIALERQHALNTPGSSTRNRNKLDVEAAFISWIDRRLAPWDTAAVSGLLAELVRVEVVSYSLYLQRMIARGETEQRTETPSMHLQLLRTVALHGEVGNPLSKRRIALRAGASARADSKRLVDAAEHEFDKLVPLEPRAIMEERDCTALLDCLQLLVKDGSQLGITRDTIPHRLALLRRASNSGACEYPLSVEDHAIFVQCFVAVQDFWGLLQYIVMILRCQPPRELQGYVLDIIEGYFDSWTSMNELGSLASALLVAHEGFKSVGISDRRTLCLLRRLGDAGFLDPAAVIQLEQDFQCLVSSLSTTRAQSQTMPPGLPELQALAADGSPQAVGQLATTLRYRYHDFDNWGQVVLEAALQLLPHVSAIVVASFLREINERLPNGIEPHIARWIETMSPAVTGSTFGGPSAPSLGTICTELVHNGTISAAQALSHLRLAWRTLLVDVTAPPIPPPTPITTHPDKGAQLRGIETIAAIFARLVGAESLPSATVSPASLLLCQRVESRRMSLYTRKSLPHIGHCMALLAIQQELWLYRENVDKAHAAGNLILQVSNGPAFRMAVARDPQALATSMLDSPFINGIPAAPFNRPKVLAALLLSLKDGSAATPATLVSTEDWDLFLSGLTIWRLAISKVEVQSCLERLDLDTSLQDVEKAEALHSLSRHFLDRVCSGAGHTYLGEQVVRCYHGRASDELVSVAFARLAEAVDGLADSASPERRASSLTTLRCTGRLLNTLLQSSQAASRPESLNVLLTAIKSCLDGLLDSENPPQREALLHSTHLIGIALRCTPGSPPLETCELFKDCLVPCAKLAANLSKDCSQESELAALLLDTCSHLLFKITSLAPTLRLPSCHTFLSAEIDIDALPNSIVQRLLRLFGFYSTIIPLANPWEMVDHADPGPLKETRHNIGPIDLAFFDAKIMEVIPAVTALDHIPQSPATSSGHSERGLQTNFDFETPCTGLPVAARDHRRTLGISKPSSASTRYDPAAKRRAATQDMAAGDSPTAGPAAAQSTSKAGKRKEAPETIVLSDDEDPVPRAPPAKRGRGSTSVKSTGRGGARKKPKLV
ncbi:protein SPA2, partial [Phenoliferia sp. Uapishka_3]